MSIAHSNCSPSNKETCNHYARVVVQGKAARIILCRQNIQWIIQRQKGGSDGRWLSLGYCTAKSTVLRLWAGLGESPCRNLDALPDRIKGLHHGT